MRRVLEYGLFFVIAVLLQIFLFNNLNLSLYLYPIVYIAPLLMLPSRTQPGMVLLCGLLVGVNVDLLSGSAGLNTIASLATAFFRPMVMKAIIGNEEVKEGVIPSPARLGRSKTFRYLLLMSVIHCLVYFSFEAMTLKYFYLTLFRIVLSASASAGLIYLTLLLFSRRK